MRSTVVSNIHLSFFKVFYITILIVMIIGCCSYASMESETENYPAIIEGLDFNGADVYFYDWWSNDTRAEEPTDDQQLQYDYWDWLEATYNVKVHQVALSDWAGNPTELAKMVMNKDASKLCVLGISSYFAGTPMANYLYMPWIYGLDMGVFNDATVNYMTRNNVSYGVSWGSAVEPRQGVFFNKRILEEANIDWNELYDLQAAGEWTWDKMEEYMDKVQRDIDMDGKLDVYALTGNGDDVTIALVVSNEADFYGYNDKGELIPTIDTENMKEAITRRIEWGSKYMRPNVQWDDYQRFWPEGNVAFMIGQSYEGFNGNSTVNQIADEWGFVAIPMGPKASRYTSAADNNVFGIPNVYDEETSLKLQQLFTLWTSPVPGTNEDSWTKNFYALTDERAIKETYAMLRQGENATIMKYNLIGDRNDSITEITWKLSGKSVDKIIKNANKAFKRRCDEFNKYYVSVRFDDSEYCITLGKSNTIKLKIIGKKKPKLEWFSSNEEIATISANGTVKGVAVGEATISARSVEYNGVISASCIIHVVVPVKKIVFSDKSITLEIGASRNLEASIEPENATNKALKWTSSNEKVATVSEDGTIMGISKGNTKITVEAMDGSKVKAVINIKVK